MDGRADSRTARWIAFEVELCRRAVKIQNRPRELALFRCVSRLGDGPLWFALAALLPLVAGVGVLPSVGRMALVGALATVVSKALKSWTGRPRPCVAHPGIAAGAAALDRWSFPSGHTLHAVAFTSVLVPDLPWLALALAPFALAVALSRVVLGLHYPSDVAAGAAVGGLLAYAVTLAW